VVPALLVVASSFDAESLALFWIMTRGVVNLAPLLHVIGTPKRPLLLLLRGLLAAISVVSSILVIISISCVDLMIILLPWGPLAPGF
jgi:hypothetical protein